MAQNVLSLLPSLQIIPATVHITEPTRHSLHFQPAAFEPNSPRPHEGQFSSGSRTVIVVPCPAMLSHVMTPWCAVATAWQMLRPRPVPVRSRFGIGYRMPSVGGSRARSESSSAEESLENMRDIVRGDSRSVVRHGQNRLLAILSDGQGDGHASSGRRVLQGIVNQVVDQLSRQVSATAHQCGSRDGRLKWQTARFSDGAKDLHGLLNKLVEPRGLLRALELPHFGLGNQQQLINQSFQLVQAIGTQARCREDDLANSTGDSRCQPVSDEWRHDQGKYDQREHESIDLGEILVQQRKRYPHANRGDSGHVRSHGALNHATVSYLKRHGTVFTNDGKLATWGSRARPDNVPIAVE